MKRIYIAGPITNDPDWKQKFGDAAAALDKLGHLPLSPSKVAETLEKSLTAGQEIPTYREYFTASLLMLLKFADAVCMLPGWENSPGAKAEHEVARALNILIYYGVEAIV